MQYLVKSQLYADAEAQKHGKDQILDDCCWSSAAATIAWASGGSVNPSAADGVAAFEKATGRKDVQGVSDAGGSLKEAAQTIAILGGHARYAKSWDDAMKAAKAGAALMVWVQQPVGYPDIHISKWHDGWRHYWTKKDPQKIHDGYGHMTSAGWCEDHGWQWACPTRDEKTAAEKYAVPVTEAQLRQIANSKVKAGKVGADYKCLLIVTHPGKAAAAPVPVVVPTEVQVAPTINVEAPRKPVEPRKAESGIKTPSELDSALNALNQVNWVDVISRETELAKNAANAAAKENGMLNKIKAAVLYVTANSQIDEMFLDAIRTFITVSLSVALGLGIPILDITGGDFRTVLSAGLASAIGVVVKFLDPNNSSYGVQKRS